MSRSWKIRCSQEIGHVSWKGPRSSGPLLDQWRQEVGRSHLDLAGQVEDMEEWRNGGILQIERDFMGIFMGFWHGMWFHRSYSWDLKIILMGFPWITLTKWGVSMEFFCWGVTGLPGPMSGLNNLAFFYPDFFGNRSGSGKPISSSCFASGLEEPNSYLPVWDRDPTWSNQCGGFHQWGYPNSWMVYFRGNPI